MRQFRVVTCGGEHAEEYILHAIEAAKKNRHKEKSDEWIDTFDSLGSRGGLKYHEPYATALDKLSDALEDRLKGDLGSKWKILKDKRKAEKRSRPDGRQLIFFVLQHLRCARTTTPEALRSLLLLSAKFKATPLSTDTMTSFLRTWDEIMLLDSASLISESDKLSHLYEIVLTCNDPEFRTQLAFYQDCLLYTSPSPRD